MKISNLSFSQNTPITQWTRMEILICYLVGVKYYSHWAMNINTYHYTAWKIWRCINGVRVFTHQITCVAHSFTSFLFDFSLRVGGVNNHAKNQFWKIGLSTISLAVFLSLCISDGTYLVSITLPCKQIVNQASDVPCIIFFHKILQNSFQKPFQFIFYFFKKLQKWK